ncbi:MAG: YdcF family protein [Pseudomonadota bacterium]
MIRFANFLRIGLGAVAVATLALVSGFFAFCATLPRAGDVPLDAVQAHRLQDRGMIILTGGGGQRITEGLALQADGLADRALISGVHPQTDKRDLAGMGDAETLDCCVDLGPWARSTRGNAVESRAWLERHGYDVALLVTSDFHLPRATAEMRHVAPEITVIGIPVASDFAPEQGWMGQVSSWRLLASEYAKYLVVRVRSLT